ncbi:MAG: hypothetical protein U0M42_09720 [Acutalibacteraceae bacterium]|nr:hypothetical protein [Acutalibacteraceae bacterium]
MSLCKLPRYFLTANSADGFINSFQKAYSVEDGFKAYLIKGGPGTGKSSFMKKVASYAQSKGEQVELVVCGSDPDSIDGVVMADKKIIMLDATAPHTVDPVYPAVCEEIINLGAFWDREKIQRYSEQIVSLTKKNKELHERAKRIISAVGQLMRNDIKVALMATDIDKTFSYGETLAKRYLKNKGRTGTERIRYLGAVTPKGYIFYPDIIEKCDNRVIIADEFSVVSDILLSVVRDIALSFGYEIITVKNNILPSEIIEYIIIPEISLAFCVKNCYNNLEANGTRLIHSQRFMNRDILKDNRGRFKLSNKLKNGLINGAVATLYEAKEVHDKLEDFYINAMDFDSLNRFCEDFLSSI